MVSHYSAVTDKAGICEIMEALSYLVAHPEIKHGKIMCAFGPDEEIGTGADHFDVKQFPVDFAYTIDGESLGQLEYETFKCGWRYCNAQRRIGSHGYRKGYHD